MPFPCVAGCRRARPSERMKLGLASSPGTPSALLTAMTTGLDSRRMPFGDRGVLGRQAAPVVDDEHDGVGFLDRDLDLLGHERRNRIGFARGEAARVDDDELAVRRAADP